MKLYDEPILLTLAMRPNDEGAPPVRVDVHATRVTEHFAVHPARDRAPNQPIFSLPWVVTHIGSGLAAARGESKRVVQLAARAFEALPIDWSGAFDMGHCALSEEQRAQCNAIRSLAAVGALAALEPML
ncbi:hypothetical protein [[Pseudomonas] boreopolis]|uniref:Uncharacterized protein n=1 Tax=Xanthomonas boreopolis TaxID=86183 RepID=A0A919F760_9XANT|nr:hypothetical protein GCM10009090_16210 [[Pseudomonas] boreopolis]